MYGALQLLGGKIGSRAVQIILILIVSRVGEKQFLESTLSQPEGLFYTFKINMWKSKIVLNTLW